MAGLSMLDNSQTMLDLDLGQYEISNLFQSSSRLRSSLSSRMGSTSSSLILA